MYVWERCSTHSNPQIHLLWSKSLSADDERALTISVIAPHTVGRIRPGLDAPRLNLGEQPATSRFYVLSITSRNRHSKPCIVDMAPLCGKPLSPEDRKVWQQAVALLMGLKIRNGLGEKELTAAVGTALHRGATKRNCEDCGLKVARGAAYSGAQGGGWMGQMGARGWTGVTGPLSSGGGS
jgi:hypothetical protein